MSTLLRLNKSVCAFILAELLQGSTATSAEHRFNKSASAFIQVLFRLCKATISKVCRPCVQIEDLQAKLCNGAVRSVMVL